MALRLLGIVVSMAVIVCYSCRRLPLCRRFPNSVKLCLTGILIVGKSDTVFLVMLECISTCFGGGVIAIHRAVLFIL